MAEIEKDIDAIINIILSGEVTKEEVKRQLTNFVVNLKTELDGLKKENAQLKQEAQEVNRVIRYLNNLLEK